MTTTAAPTATLTRIRLNPRCPAVRRDLYDAVQQHKTVMRLIPQGLGPQARQHAGLLFRLERDPAPTLLIQTLQPPNLAALPHAYGTAETRDLSRMLNGLIAGMPVRYRITANPSAHQPSPHGQRGKIMELTGDKALTWWQTRAQRVGLALHTIDATRVTFHAPRNQAGPIHPLTRFDGLAIITDPASLAQALLTGIGRGKPYGAGLLTLAPA